MAKHADIAHAVPRILNVFIVKRTKKDSPPSLKGGAAYPLGGREKSLSNSPLKTEDSVPIGGRGKHRASLIMNYEFPKSSAPVAIRYCPRSRA